MIQKTDIQLLRKLGSGGFGEVHEATIANFRGKVAIKYLKVQDADAKRRLVREVKLLSSLTHKNIIPILDYQLEVEPFWFAMPLADESLFDRISNGKIPAQEANAIFLQILDGVQYAHEHALRVIHRDLKPENILLLGDDLFISDFGLGKPLERGELYSVLTQYTVGIGSQGYSPPEQLADVRNAYEQADIFALGMLLYTMLTSSMPYPLFDISRIPYRYQYIIQRCTRQTPDDRFSSVAELRVKFLSAIDRSSFQISSPDEELLANLFARPCTPELANDVLRIFYDNGDNRRLYKACFPDLPREYVLHFSQDGLLDDFRHILTQFDEYISGSLNFQYCDVVADFYQSIGEICNDIDVFKLLLERLLVMGVMHNRWHVMDVFCSILCKIAQGDSRKTMTAIEVIEKHPEDFRLVHMNKSQILSECSLPRVLRATIGRISGASNAK